MFFIFFSCRNELLTLKHYARKVLHFMRTQKLDAAWRKYLLELDLGKSSSILEGVVFMSKFWRMNQEEIPSLTNISSSIDEIVSRVTELMNSSSQKSTKKTISFINQVLFEEMGFQGIENKDHFLDNCFFDKVNTSQNVVKFFFNIIFLKFLF